VTAAERCEAIKDMLEPDGWTVHWNGRDSQREPGYGIVCKLGDKGPSLRSFSSDSLEVAVARMENALFSLASMNKHAYFSVRPGPPLGTLS
jgi:hypothetical protein